MQGLNSWIPPRLRCNLRTVKTRKIHNISALKGFMMRRWSDWGGDGGRLKCLKVDRTGGSVGVVPFFRSATGSFLICPSLSDSREGEREKCGPRELGRQCVTSRRFCYLGVYLEQASPFSPVRTCALCSSVAKLIKINAVILYLNAWNRLCICQL